MGASWTLVKAFLREATERTDYSQEESVETVYTKIRAIQRGHFTLATESDGVVQVSSTIGATSFSFALPQRLDRVEIIEVAERALEVIDGLTTVAEIRALLVRTRTTRTDRSAWIVP